MIYYMPSKAFPYLNFIALVFFQAWNINKIGGDHVLPLFVEDTRIPSREMQIS